MCLIITSKTGELPKQDILTRAWDGNPHGWGLMTAKEDQLKITKGLSKDDLDKAIKQQIVPGTPYVLHYRWATHGPKTRDNCHPFEVTPYLYMAHNGVISGIEITDEARSDSYHFAAKLAEIGLDEETLQDKGVQDCIADWVGWSNKLAFMDAQGRITIINEEMGETVGDIWYSNNLAIDEAAYWREEAAYLQRQLDWVTNEYQTFRAIDIVISGGDN